MPQRNPKDPNAVKYPDWVENQEDGCLRNSLKEALSARDGAIRSGVTNPGTHPSCKREFDSANQVLNRIRDGSVVGAAACTKATVAARKFVRAGDCHRPIKKGPIKPTQR